MTRLTVLLLSALGALLATPADAINPPTPATTPAKPPARPAAGKVLELDWDELVPKGEREQYTFEPPPPSHYLDESGPAATQQGSAKVNEALNGALVKIAGFVVPLHMTSKGIVTEFLLVPYFGACIHVPPPPPNQIVHVRMKKGVALDSIYDALWITGRMKTTLTSTRLARASYTMEGEKVEVYSY